MSVCMSVCRSVMLWNTLFRRLSRLLVKGRIANIVCSDKKQKLKNQPPPLLKKILKNIRLAPRKYCWVFFCIPLLRTIKAKYCPAHPITIIWRLSSLQDLHGVLPPNPWLKKKNEVENLDNTYFSPNWHTGPIRSSSCNVRLYVSRLYVSGRVSCPLPMQAGRRRRQRQQRRLLGERRRWAQEEKKNIKIKY